ncbi:hypothetical protein IAQ61_011199 [Plenodomus lingam]|uniref:uncharacterized protein n=1 Tax=Leptosphaeria maculans TaxID=5022 RepID=UPI0033325F06|nr:hypothetical protein IAQ61_011199 [Plenodomus lingam]
MRRTEEHDHGGRELTCQCERLPMEEGAGAEGEEVGKRVEDWVMAKGNQRRFAAVGRVVVGLWVSWESIQSNTKQHKIDHLTTVAGTAVVAPAAASQEPLSSPKVTYG